MDTMHKLYYYKNLADMFRYPDEHFAKYTSAFLKMMLDELPEKVGVMQQIIEKHEQLSIQDQQEYYLKT
ncbi:MAG: hypothetical protein DRI97_10395, partial [Bacteroidetes bacterium]